MVDSTTELLTTTELLILAQQKFAHQLTDADMKLFCAIACDKEANFKSSTENLNDPNKTEQWGTERTLGADRLVWLLTTPKVVEFLSFRGLRISGAKIVGDLNLEYATVSVPLIFNTCAFMGLLKLEKSKLKALELKYTRVSQIKAKEMQVEGSVSLCDGFNAKGKVDLIGASIGGQLDCSGGQFHYDNNEPNNEHKIAIDEHKIAIDAAGAKIAANVLLCKPFEEKGEKTFKAEGQVNLHGASIGGKLNCSGGQFYNPGKIAIDAYGAKITTNVFLNNGFEAKGEVKLHRASIGEQLDCSGGQFYNPGKIAIDAESAKIDGGVFLGDKTEQEKTSTPEVATDNGSQNKTEQDTTQFKVEGKLNFFSATIGDRLELLALKSERSDKPMSLDLQFVQVNIFSFEGTNAEKSWIEDMTKGNLRLNGLVYRTIKFSNEAIKNGLFLDWLRLQLKKEAPPPKKEASPPEKEASPPEKENFALQPYEQLAAVLKADGYQEAAIKVLIAKEDDRRKYGDLSALKKCWNCFLGLTIAHGYHPEKALIYSVTIILAGWIIFSQNSSLMTAKDGKNEFFTFNPLVYSIDTFMPGIDFHQESAWLPNPNKPDSKTDSKKPDPKTDPKKGKQVLILRLNGECLRVYFWLQIVAGWVLTTLWVAGFTGLVRNRK
ncbi:hypothetical protein ACE1CI_34590 [Aerosakkonemataceae cyanobacterium BLCC-F50]|uniref:Uncharacterized protein n=1 Tax=Floridaenema flaviceps BLCC-F50 TaxID=3153642 RepID=A0ABV4Y2B7_9CYAN